MADQVLRDKHNKLLGKIKTLSNGKMELRDAHNKKMGSMIQKPIKQEMNEIDLLARETFWGTLL